MFKVLSLVPKSRIDRFGVKPPAGVEITFLEPPFTDDEVIEAGKGADCIFVGAVDPVSRKVIYALDTLKLIHSEGVGFDKIDVEAAKERNVYVCNNRNVNSGAVAEHTVGLIIAALRRIPYADKEIKKGNYGPCQLEYRTKGYNELSSRHVGIVGLGAIGRETAKRLRPFGCKISYYDAFRPAKEVEEELGVQYLSFEDICRQCDVISFHVPVLPETRHMVNETSIGWMKDGVILINTARGEIIDQVALAKALEEGKIACAALDTVTPEPPGEDHPLLNLSEKASDRLIITPHIGGTTDEAFQRMHTWAWENVQRVMEGKKPVNIVNRL